MRSMLAQERLFLLACLLCGLPVMLSAYPPMVDVPQHAAQIASLKAMIFGSWPFSGLFEIQLFTPYWIGYGLVMGLSVPFGIVLATKLVVAAAQSLFVWAAARFCRRMGVPSLALWPLLILPFGFSYQWGFLNFIVAAPFGFLFLTALLGSNGRHDWRAFLKVVLWLHFLFFSHILIAGFFSMVAMSILATRSSGLGDWLRKCLPVFSVLPVTALWLWYGVQNGPLGDSIIWGIGLERLTSFLPLFVSSPVPLTGQVLGLLCLALPFLLGAKPRRSLLVWLPFLLYMAWMVLVPRYVGGNYFTSERFGIFGLPLYLVCFRYVPISHESGPKLSLSMIMIILPLMMVGWQCIRGMTFNAETAGYQAVMQKTAPGKRMLMLALDPMSRASSAPLFLHFAGWYQAERNGLAEFSFSRFYVSPVQYRKDASSGISQGFEWYPHLLDWRENKGALYDYILIRHRLDAEDWLQERSGGSVELLSRRGEWQLYGVVK